MQWNLVGWKETSLDANKHYSMQRNITQCKQITIYGNKNHSMQWNIMQCKQITIDGSKQCSMQGNIAQCNETSLSVKKQRSMQRNINRLWPSIDRFLAKHRSIQSSIDRSFPHDRFCFRSINFSAIDHRLWILKQMAHHIKHGSITEMGEWQCLGLKLQHTCTVLSQPSQLLYKFYTKTWFNAFS